MFLSYLLHQRKVETKINKLCLCALRFLFLRVVHDVRPQRRHGRISNHQRPDLQVKQVLEIRTLQTTFHIIDEQIFHLNFSFQYD